MEWIYFNEEHLMLRRMVRDFAINEIKPLSQKIDQEGLFPHESIKKMADLGLMGIPWNSKYGGNDMDTLSLVIAIEEIGKVCASTAATMMAHTSKKIGSFGLTEPNAGSDAGNTQTTAVFKNGYFIINGQKSFCTSAGVASTIIFTAKLIKDGVDQGIGAFIVEAGEKGLSLGKPEKKMGWRGSDTRSVFFENMKIPEDNILGSPSRGFKQFLKTLVGGRITIGALSLGTAQGAYELACSYSKERNAFGKSINQFQGVSFKLSDMATSIEAAKHLVYHAAWLKDNNQSIIKEAAMAKLFASETAMKICTEAIQIHGGYGYIKEYDVERFFRDAKILEIGEGTSEVQRIIIAKEILK